MSYLRKEVESEAKIEEDMKKHGGSKKILFVGLSQTGKTSIIHVVFSGWKPGDTRDIPPTINFTKQTKRYSNLNVFVFDVGGQTAFMEQAFGPSKETVFSDTDYLFFVVDAANPLENNKARELFLWAVRNVRKLAKNAKIQILVHKMDLIPDESHEIVINQVAEIFNLEEFHDVKLSGTSIYNSSIFEIIEKNLA